MSDINEVREKEIEILENIQQHPDSVRQRDLAEIAGLSLGMTNAILRRLAQKGFLQIRKVNNRNIRYIVSAKGVEAITRKSYRYFRRTIRNVVYYRKEIDSFVSELKKKGYTGLVLVGASDLDFIVEHACGFHGVKYIRDEQSERGQCFYLYSESYLPDDETKEENETGSVEFLQNILIWE